MTSLCPRNIRSLSEACYPHMGAVSFFTIAFVFFSSGAGDATTSPQPALFY